MLPFVEWSDKEKIIAVIVPKVDKETNIFFKNLHSLGISQIFVYWASDRHNETSSICDRKRSGRPHCVRTKKVMKAVRDKIPIEEVHDTIDN